MMKLALLAFLLRVLSVAAAVVSTKESCRREITKSASTLSTGAAPPRKHGQSQLLTGTSNGVFEGDSDTEGSAPQESCMQLRQARRDCRCAVIRDMMQQMKEEEGFGMGQECRGRCGETMTRGRYLTAMCDVEPHTCRMSQGGGY